MKHFKFIVNPNGELRFGYVELHKHLLDNPFSERALGGGMYEVDKRKKEITLYGDSGDYGVPNLSKATSIADSITFWDDDVCKMAFENISEFSDYTITYKEWDWAKKVRDFMLPVKI